MKQILYFSSPTCTPCHAMRPIIQGLQSEISVTFIDTNASPQTTKTWNVRSVPTTIVVKNGREIGRLVGVKVANEVRALYNR